MALVPFARSEAAKPSPNEENFIPEELKSARINKSIKDPLFSSFLGKPREFISEGCAEKFHGIIILSAIVGNSGLF